MTRSAPVDDTTKRCPSILARRGAGPAETNAKVVNKLHTQPRILIKAQSYLPQHWL